MLPQVTRNPSVWKAGKAQNETMYNAFNAQLYDILTSETLRQVGEA